MTNSSRLVVSQGPEPGQVFELRQDSQTIGRAPGNEIVISDPQVSRQHVRISKEGGLLVIEDLGSTNGTTINGVRLTGPHTLTNGDVIGLGDQVTMTFYGTGVEATDTVIGQPAPQAPAPQPSYAPPPAQSQPVAAAQPRPTPPPQDYAYADEELKEEGQSQRWIIFGCAGLLLLAIAACIIIFVLDYLQVLPPFFYTPLRWLGFV